MLLQFISVESLRYYSESEKFGTRKLIVKRGSTIDVHPSLVYTYWTFVTFIFGASVCESLTFIAKCTVGKSLRNVDLCHVKILIDTV